MKMKKSATIAAIALGATLMAAPLWAAGPDTAPDQARAAMLLAQGQGGSRAGGGQAEERMREGQRTQEEMREQAERQQEQARDRREDSGPSDNRGMEQQRERVMEQEQRELDRGSEQGQEAREHRRKWWRFWDRSED